MIKTLPLKMQEMLGKLPWILMSSHISWR